MNRFSTHRNLNLAASLAAVFAFGMLVSSGVSAQGVYRVVGPDGKVSYSDQPPPASTGARPVGGATAAASSGGAALPSDLRQAAGRYPVTLYAGSDCAPCDTGRNFLTTRGIPFTEKTVNSSDDIAAFKRLSGRVQPAHAGGGRSAPQGLFGFRVEPVPGRGGLPQDLGSASGLSPAGSHTSGGSQGRGSACCLAGPKGTGTQGAGRDSGDRAGHQSQRHQVLDHGRATAAVDFLSQNVSVFTPPGVPSRQTWAFWCANTPTVTTPGH